MCEGRGVCVCEGEEGCVKERRDVCMYVCVCGSHIYFTFHNSTLKMKNP